MVLRQSRRHPGVPRALPFGSVAMPCTFWSSLSRRAPELNANEFSPNALALNNSRALWVLNLHLYNNGYLSRRHLKGYDLRTSLDKTLAQVKRMEPGPKKNPDITTII